jgi:hypothetical protein
MIFAIMICAEIKTLIVLADAMNATVSADAVGIGTATATVIGTRFSVI